MSQMGKPTGPILRIKLRGDFLLLYGDKSITSIAAVVGDRLVQSLDELWRLLRELDFQTYNFSHIKIRDSSYESLSATRRWHLHRQVAQALETRFAWGAGETAGPVKITPFRFRLQHVNCSICPDTASDSCEIYHQTFQDRLVCYAVCNMDKLR